MKKKSKSKVLKIQVTKSILLKRVLKVLRKDPIGDGTVDDGIK